MKKNALNIIAGVASLFDWFPATDYTRFIPKKTAAARMHSHWLRTGDSIRNATASYGRKQARKASVK